MGSGSGGRFREDSQQEFEFDVVVEARTTSDATVDLAVVQAPRPCRA